MNVKLFTNNGRSATYHAASWVALGGALVIGSALMSGTAHGRDLPQRPNFLLVITDDHGWGDVGFHGNRQIATPRLDRLASESLELENFYVCPVCSPTRASLLTGRYHFRTGVIDTNSGRSMMHTDEVTLAEMLRDAGYDTAIFGKWHLGDNYPMRPMDQGFTESLVHRGGGCGQPADPPGNSYFNPVLQHNGQPQQTKGYVTDVLTQAAVNYLGQPRDRPFFLYVAYNCPHEPLQVPEEYLQRYRYAGLNDTTARVYAMVTNIDDNAGRLLDELARHGLSDSTIVIFLTDNGPQHARYNAGLRGLKTTVYEGGIRVPMLVRYPPAVKPGKTSQVAAHIDLTPTLVEACGARTDAKLDGVSLWPLLTGQRSNLPERTIFIQWHRGDAPEMYRSFAARNGRHKLVQAAGGDPARQPLVPKFELFDLQNDPSEQLNLSTEKPEVAERLKQDYTAWFDEVSATRGFNPPRIVLGSDHENPATLTRQDWRGANAGWSATSSGHWEVQFAKSGSYDITVRVPKSDKPANVELQIGPKKWPRMLAAGQEAVTLSDLDLPDGESQVAATFTQAGRTAGAHYVDVLRRGQNPSKAVAE